MARMARYYDSHGSHGSLLWLACGSHCILTFAESNSENDDSNRSIGVPKGRNAIVEHFVHDLPSKKMFLPASICTCSLWLFLSCSFAMPSDIEYTNFTSFADGKYTARWKFHNETEIFYFKVEVKATGWVGFGISRLLWPSNERLQWNRRSMRYYDVIVGGVFGNGTEYHKVSSNNFIFVLYDDIPANFFDAKAWDFHQDIVQSLRSDPKMPKNLPKIYEDNPNVSEDPPIIFGTRSKDIICQTQPLLFRKSENLSWRTVIYAHFSIRYSFEYKLHVYILCICQAFVRYSCNNSYFPVRHEKLIRRRDWTWDWSFPLAGVRLGPKAWELAGIWWLGWYWDIPKIFRIWGWREQFWHHLFFAVSTYTVWRQSSLGCIRGV